MGKKTWKTKFGLRQVKQELPTIEEALTAAECLTDDLNQQLEIAASLMGIESEKVREAAKWRPPALLEKRDILQIKRIGSDTNTRAVVVERRAPRRLIRP